MDVKHKETDRIPLHIQHKAVAAIYRKGAAKAAPGPDKTNALEIAEALEAEADRLLGSEVYQMNLQSSVNLEREK